MDKQVVEAVHTDLYCPMALVVHTDYQPEAAQGVERVVAWVELPEPVMML